MRYYRIVITDPVTNEVMVPNLFGQPGFSRMPFSDTASSYTSLNLGATVDAIGGTNPAAQDIEIDVALAYMHDPIANSYVKVWGVSLAEIAQGSNLNGFNISVYGGMAKGLPLANPQQSGLLCSGKIFQCFGNSIGTQQSLDIYVFYGGESPSSNQVTGQPATNSTTPYFSNNDHPANLVFQWNPGMDFISTVATPLMGVYPKYKIQGAVSPNLVWTGAPTTGFFADLKQFAEFIRERSLSIVGGYAPDTRKYPGVSISLNHDTITITDGTTQTPPKQIQLVDLIGQPTWTSLYEVQVTCVLRADINLWDYVTLPIGMNQITAGANSQFFQGITGNSYGGYKNNAIFSGTFMVKTMRHVGQLRNPDGRAWVTTMDLLLSLPPETQVDSYPILYNGVTANNTAAS